MPTLAKAAALAAVTSLLGTPVAAQEAAEPPVAGTPSTTAAPGIQDAVVLSTGSSRGLAHAGALEGFEHEGLDPDLVVGTSMGAVIGAMWAAGISAEEIVATVRSTEWAELFMPLPLVLGPDRDVRFPALSVGLSFGPFEVARGIVADWRVNRFLTAVLFDAGARARSDFDRLPRRFRAVTTDLSSGEEVVLAAGDLARAARVSMGVPGFFAGKEWDGRLLGDGGISNYLPVSVARALGARRVAAVDVSRPPPEIRRTDPAALGGRSLALLMRNALPDTVPPEVPVRPEIDPDFPGAVFPADPSRLVDLGLIAVLEADLHPTPGGVRSRTPAPAPERLVALEIESPDSTLASFARSVFADAVGAYRPERVLAAVDHLYASGLFAGVWPRVEGRPGGDVLVVRLEPFPRVEVATALGFDNDRGARLWAALDGRAGAFGLPLDVRAAGGTDGIERWWTGSALLHLPPWAGLALSVGALHSERTPPFSEGDGPDPEVRRTGGWLGLQHRIAFPDVAVSLLVRADHLDVEGGAEGLEWGPLLRIARIEPPNRVVGVPDRVDLELRRGQVRFARVGLSGSLERGDDLAAVLQLDATLHEPPPDVLPALGDGHAMPGLRWGQERARARIVTGLDLARPVLGGGWARLRLRAGATGDDADAFGRSGSWMAGAALEGIWGTPVGTVLVGWGINTDGRHRIDASLGAAF